MDPFSFPVPLLLYTGLNILAFAAFAGDKLAAKTRMARSPENLLLVLAALGPFGAIVAMAVFRHKTRHVKFFLVPVFLTVHLFLFFRFQDSFP